MAGHVTYTLKKPIQVVKKGTDGDSIETLTQLTFRDEVVAGDLRGIKLAVLGDPAGDDLLKIASRLCAQPEIVLNKLGIPDTIAIGEIVFGFLGAGLEIPTAPSGS